LTGNIEEASVWFDKYIYASKNPKAIISLCEEFKSANQVDPAIRGFIQALSMLKETDMGSRLPAIGSLAVLYIAKRDTGGALTYSKEWIALAPNLLQANYNYAYALMLAGRLIEAKEYFTKSLDLFENTPVVKYAPQIGANLHQAISRAFIVLARPDKGREALMEALKVASTVQTPIFSCLQYRYVPAEEFRQETERLVANPSPLLA